MTNYSNNEKEGTPIWLVLLAGYFILAQLFLPYFWWLYAKEHSFWESVLLGGFVSEFKSIFWIFFIGN